MPYISWHTTRFLVFYSLVVGILSQTTINRTTTPATTTTSRPLRSCQDPPVLENGNHYGDKRYRGAYISYYCYPGYKLSGFVVYVCSPVIGSGQYDPLEGRSHPKLAWVPEFSTSCERIPLAVATTVKPKELPCTLPQPKDRNLILRDWRKEYPVNSGVVYSCRTGYVLVGKEVRWCQSGKMWLPEEEPRCVDKAMTLPTEPPTTPSKREPLTIMKIILYVSIPLLVVFVLAIVCNLKRQRAKRNRRSLARSSSPQQDDPMYPQLLPTRATGYAGLAAHQYYASPTAPPPHLLNSNEFNVPFTIIENASVPDIQQHPPSYEEATRDSSLPSFELAQKLHNSSTNISNLSRESVH